MTVVCGGTTGREGAGSVAPPQPRPGAASDRPARPGVLATVRRWSVCATGTGPFASGEFERKGGASCWRRSSRRCLAGSARRGEAAATWRRSRGSACTPGCRSATRRLHDLYAATDCSPCRRPTPASPSRPAMSGRCAGAWARSSATRHGAGPWASRARQCRTRAQRRGQHAPRARPGLGGCHGPLPALNQSRVVRTHVCARRPVATRPSTRIRPTTNAGA